MNSVLPQNFQLQKWQSCFLVWVCDSLQKVCLSSEVAGTRSVVAPELYHDGECHAEEATCWMVGVLLYELIWGSWPYASPPSSDFLFPVMGGHPKLRNICEKLLKRDAKQRISLKECKSLLDELLSTN